MKNRIQVVDAVMGAGKTSYAIQMMKERTSERFLYITPYISEIHRIVVAVPGFFQPAAKKDPKDPESKPRKLHHLKQLLEEGVNIVSSHALFEYIDGEVLRLVEGLGYILVLDEVMEVLRQPPKLDPHRERGGRGRKTSFADDDEDKWGDDADEHSPEAQKYREWLAGLLRHKILIQESASDCCNLQAGPETCFPEFGHLQRYAREGRLVMVNGSLLIWQFPTNCFAAFKEVWNLTFLFDGTYQAAYYDLHGLAFERLSVVKQGERYAVVKHSPEYDRPAIEKARELIRVYQGTKNVAHPVPRTQGCCSRGLL